MSWIIMLKVRPALKAGRDLYPERMSFPNDRKRKEPWSVWPLGAPFSSCLWGASLLPCPGCPGLWNAVCRRHTGYLIAASPRNIYFLVVLIPTGPSPGFGDCDCWLRRPHHREDPTNLFPKAWLPWSSGELFKQHTGFHVLCKQRGPSRADDTRVAWLLYFHLLVLRNKISPLRHSCVTNGRPMSW